MTFSTSNQLVRAMQIQVNLISSKPLPILKCMLLPVYDWKTPLILLEETNIIRVIVCVWVSLSKSNSNLLVNIKWIKTYDSGVKSFKSNVKIYVVVVVVF